MTSDSGAPAVDTLVSPSDADTARRRISVLALIDTALAAAGGVT
jgi:hypothetical protein